MKKEIFVSSTFKDFQVERELLLKEVQQEINTLLSNKHLGVNFIDLRWGIDTNKGGLETVITFCIDYVIEPLISKDTRFLLKTFLRNISTSVTSGSSYPRYI